jgi:microcystin-dependent protein
MPFKRPKARILERTITAGNGPYALAGAVDGSYNTFASFMANGDVTEVSVVEPGVAFWTGIVTFNTGPDRITLTTVEESSGTFGAGTKEIFAGTLAARSAFFDDVSGAIVTGGTATAYTIASYRNYDSLVRLDNALIAFTPHATNANAAGSDMTLAVDGLAAKPIRMTPGSPIPSASLILGTPYFALYNNADGVFYLHGSMNPFNVPLLGEIGYWDTVAPSTCFIFPRGQALSRVTFAYAFSRWGTDHGSGDGFTTFNAPNGMGRVGIQRETTASLISPTFFGDSTNMGEKGGGQSSIIVTGNLPAYTPSGSITNGAITINGAASNNTPGGTSDLAIGSLQGSYGAASLSASQAASTFAGNAQGGSSTPLRTMMPGIIRETLIRVL